MTHTIHGYMKERLLDNRILCYRFSDTQRDTMDAWAIDLSGEMRAWSPNIPFRLLIDARLKQSSDFTTYGFRRAREVAGVHLKTSSRLAVLVNSTLVEHVMNSLFRTMPNPHRLRRVFHDETAAIAWLSQPDTIEKR